MDKSKYDSPGMSREGVGADETFTCPFCGGMARIATFCLDGDELYQALCDRCGTPSYFSDSPEAAKDSWRREAGDIRRRN